MYKHIVCDPDKCVGCGLCELACSSTKHQVFNPLLSRIRAERIEPIVIMAVSCRMCEEAPCVIACPRQALSQDPRKGTILVDQDKCDGCGWCVEACDFGAMLLNPATKRVEVCDLCADQDEPQCMKHCPKDALLLSTPGIVSQNARREVVAKLLRELTVG